MREVDEALARAYARGAKADPSRAVPPAPHWPAPAASPPPSHTPAGRTLSERDEADAPTWAGAGRSPATDGPATELLWPPVVLRLEHDWGDRFDRLAGRLVEARNRQNVRVVLFTSCHRAEGRTTLVLTLARALSRHPGRTVVVDADLTGPMLARLLGLRPEVGLDDVVDGGHPSMRH